MSTTRPDRQRHCTHASRQLASTLGILALVTAPLACGSDTTPESNPGSGGVTGSGATGGATPGSGGTGTGATGGVASGGATNNTGGGSGSTATGGSGGSAPVGNAVFTVNASISPEIATVGIVEWSIDKTIDSAHIAFGRQQGSFEYQAMVEAPAASNRTLLLGMKPATTYYFQIVAEGGGETYQSEVYTIDTGYLANGLPPVTINDVIPGAAYGGFTVYCNGISGATGGMVPQSTWAMIFDRDGDYVWAYPLTGTAVAGCSRARMAFDGQHLWAGNFSNVSPDGALLRISMDGLSADTYEFPGRHHDFAVLPNNHVLFYEQENGGGGIGAGEGQDILYELDPETRQVTELYQENRDFSQQISESGAHTNQINFWPELNAISFSMRHTSTIGVISYPGAELLTVFGGPLSDFAQIDISGQHGHHLLADSILIFDNEHDSRVVEYSYDKNTGQAEQIFEYTSDVRAVFFGDVKRLPNGNVLVTYSPNGVIHEVNSAEALVREITVTSMGYTEHRTTLYGPPPPFGD